MSFEAIKAAFPKADNLTRLIKQDGITRDIQDAIQDVYSKSWKQSAVAAKQLKGLSDLETAKNVWHFVRYGITYRLDPLGDQLIPTPARVVSQGFADCKGKSILVASLLQNLGIKVRFRFVAYNGGNQVTHIYNVATIKGIDYPIDACIDEFGIEKKYTFKEDRMANIMAISGPDMDEVAISGIEIGQSEGEIDLRLMRETKALERAIIQGNAAIAGPEEQENYSRAIAAISQEIADYDRAIAAIPYGPDAVVAVGSAIGAAIGKRKRSRFGRFLSKAAKRAGTITKAGLKLAKKGAVFALKVATAPMRLAANGIIRVFLPKLAPNFLYLFINNPETIKALPGRVKAKRAKQEKTASIIKQAVGMSSKTFMRIVRNGIMRKFKKTPEAILSAQVKGRLNGIGIEPTTTLAAAGQTADLLTKLFAALSKLLGGKTEPTMKATDAVDLFSDFNGASSKARRLVVANQRYKSATYKGQEPNDQPTEAYEQRREQQVITRVQNEPETTATDEPLPQPELPEPVNTESENFNSATTPKQQRASTTKGGSGLIEPKAVKSLTTNASNTRQEDPESIEETEQTGTKVTASKAEETVQAQKSNSGISPLILGAVAAGAIYMMSAKKAKGKK